MKCCVRSILIHLVEADGKGEWWHQMNSHDFLWSIFNLQQGNTSFEGSEESLGQFSWVPCTSHHHPTATLTEGHSVPSSIILGSPSWIPYCLPPLFPCPRAPGPSFDLGDQNEVVMTSSAS